MGMAYIVADQGLFPTYFTHSGHDHFSFSKQERVYLYYKSIYVKYFYLIHLIFREQSFTTADILKRFLVDTNIGELGQDRFEAVQGGFIMLHLIVK